MISIVTTSTVAAVATVGLIGSLPLISVLLLLSFLIQKELIGGLSSNRIERFKQALNVGIAPLLIVFVLTVLYKVAEAIR